MHSPPQGGRALIADFRLTRCCADARDSLDGWPDDRSYISKVGEPAPFWNADRFVREKSPAGSHERNSSLAPLISSPEQEQEILRDSPSPNSSDVELMSLGDSGSEVSDVASVLSSHPPLSPSLARDHHPSSQSSS